MLLAQSSPAEVLSGMVGMVFFFAFWALIIAAAIWFFRGPAQAADNYVNTLALQFDAKDAALFRNIYATKGPKSTVVAWLLTVFLSPTVSYIYQGKWALALISFITIQGLGFWWLISIFSMPSEVLTMNKRLADEAYQQVALRGSSTPQIINVNQYTYIPAHGPAPSAQQGPLQTDAGETATHAQEPTEISPTVRVRAEPDEPKGTWITPSSPPPPTEPPGTSVMPT